MTVYLFSLLRRPNGRSDCIKTFNIFESLIKVFGLPPWDKICPQELRYLTYLYCSKIRDVLKRGYLCSYCACARRKRPIEMK